MALRGDSRGAGTARCDCGNDAELGEAARTGDPESACCSRGGHATRGCRASADAQATEHVRAERGRGNDRQGDREHRALTANLVAVLAAAGANLEVMAQLRSAQGAAAQRRELLADLAARRLAGRP